MIVGTNPEQIAKKLLLLLVGKPPQSRSIINSEKGYQSYILFKHNESQKFNSIEALNYLEQNFGSEGLINSHVQSKTIIFDIPVDQSEGLANKLKELTPNTYKIRVASSEDK